MPVNVTVRLDDAAITRMLTSPEGDVVRDAFRRGKQVETIAKQRCPVNTGRLRSSIQTNVHAGFGRQPIVTVGSDVQYALWVHDGTGVYANRSPITPKRSKFLRFNVGVRTVYARQVRGQRSVPFLRNALPAAVK